MRRARASGSEHAVCAASACGGEKRDASDIDIMTHGYSTRSYNVLIPSDVA